MAAPCTPEDEDLTITGLLRTYAAGGNAVNEVLFEYDAVRAITIIDGERIRILDGSSFPGEVPVPLLCCRYHQRWIQGTSRPSARHRSRAASCSAGEKVSGKAPVKAGGESRMKEPYGKGLATRGRP